MAQKFHDKHKDSLSTVERHAHKAVFGGLPQSFDPRLKASVGWLLECIEDLEARLAAVESKQDATTPVEVVARKPFIRKVA